MLATVVCAILCGARGCVGIAEWIRFQSPNVWHWLGFFRKPPTHNAFRNLLMALPPERFEAALRRWIAEILPPPVENAALQPVALDGKGLCGTPTAHQRSIHLLAMLDQQNQLHWVRGATFGEDHSRIRTGHAPEIFAALRNAATDVLRLHNATNVAAAPRHHAHCLTDLLKLVGILKH